MTNDDDRPDEHLEDVDDGGGCAELWEASVEARREDDE